MKWFTLVVDMRTMERLNMSKATLLLVLMINFCSVSAYAVCDPSFANPLTDISWTCTLPIRLGGAVISPRSSDNSKRYVKNTMCTCVYGNIKRWGLTVGFWEPAHMIDVSKDSGCFSGLGIEVDFLKKAWSNGVIGQSHGDESGQSTYFSQVHLIQYPVYAMLELLTDFDCANRQNVIGLDILQLSELSPTHADDLTATILSPESVLFASPIGTLACSADAISSNLGYPIDQLFHCAGSWGIVYPLTGRASGQNLTQSALLVAAKSLFYYNRLMILMDNDGPEALCNPVYSPIWEKGGYRLQQMRPVKSKHCLPIGKSTMMYPGLNKPTKKGQDNFTYMLYNNVDCCSFIY